VVVRAWHTALRHHGHADSHLCLLLAYWINFNDKLCSVTRILPGNRRIDGQGGLLYQIEAAAITPGDDLSVRDQLLHIIEPISASLSREIRDRARQGTACAGL